MSKKYLFDHYIKEGSVVGEDSLRTLLGLIYADTPLNLNTLEGKFINFIIEQYEKNLSLSKSFKGVHKISKTSTLADLTSDEHDALIQIFKNIKKIDTKLFSDFNFQIDDDKDISLTVQTINRALNTFDIKQGDDFFTNGDLDPQKEETSLKFAYAFKTIGLKGETEIITKQTQLTPDAINLQKFASNENLNQKITKLKNLIYFGDESDSIEKEIIGEGSQQDIGIDKIYNLVTIDIPKQENGLSDNNVWSYITKDFNVLMNNINIDKNKLGLEEIQKFIQLYYKTIFVDYLARLLSTQIPGQIKQITNSTDPTLRSFGAPFSEVQGVFQALLSPDSEQFKLSVSKGQAEFILKRGKELALALKGTANNNFSNNATLISNNFPSSLGDILAPNINNVSSRLYSMALSIPLYFDSLGIILDNNLRNYSITEMFKGVFKNPDNKFVYDFGIRQDNLLRKAKLVGLRVVKSLEPFDAETGFDPSKPLQTFHIPVQLTNEEQQIRLFDSQIVYGTTYYYTTYGIYAVDGKYYYYDNMQLKIIPAKFETEIEDIKGIVDNTFVNEKDQFVNPCCRFSKSSLNLDLSNSPIYAGQTAASLGVSNEFQATKKFWDKKISSDLKIPYSERVQNALGLFPIVADGKGNYPTTIINGLNDVNSYLTQVLTRLYNEDDAGIYNGLATYRTAPSYEKSSLICFLCSGRGGDTSKSIPRPYRLIQTRLNQTRKTFVDNYNGNLFGTGTDSGLINCQDFGYKYPTGNTKQLNSNDIFPQPVVAESNDNPLGDDSPAIRNTDPTADNANAVKYRCKSFDTIKTVENKKLIEKEKFEEFSFEIKETNATTLYDIPLGESVESSVIDVVPVPPVVTFVPLADVNNKIKIKFQEAVQSDYSAITPDAASKEKNGPVIMDKLEKQYEKLSLSGEVNVYSFFPKKIASRSQNDLLSIHALKLDRKPDSLQDLVENAEEYVLNFKNGQTTYMSNLKPNQKYYYTFISRDIAGLYSNATETYEVELVEDSGFTYASIVPYTYEQKIERQTEKTFQKLLKIKPSFEELLPNNASSVGTSDLYSTITTKTSSAVGEQPPRFKIRVTSKKTKRTFDINLKFTQRITEVTSARLLKQLKKVSDLIDEVETNS